MALIPSLSLWSSIKIPFLCVGKNKNTPDISYVDSCNGSKQKNHEKKAKPVQETVNLRVPNYLSKIENSTPNLFFCTVSSNNKKKTHRKCFSRSKNKQINHVTIPDGFNVSKKNDWEEIFAKNYEDSILDSYSSMTALLEEDLNASSFDRFLETVAFENIPTVKSCTQKELNEINKIYNLENELVKTNGKKKRKVQHKENLYRNSQSEEISMETSGRLSKEKEFNTFEVPFSETLRNNELNFKSKVFHNKYASDHFESDFVPKQNHIKSNYFTQKLVKMKDEPTDADYYENKLADLYVLELGLKI